MRKRLSIAVCLSLLVGFIAGSGCTSIPDSRSVSSPEGADSGSGGATGTGGSSGATSGGASGSGGATSGGSGGTATGGTTGSGGSAQDGGGADGGGTGGGTGLPCGTATCHSREIGNETLAACCVSASKSTCGLETVVMGTLVCVQPNELGDLDSKCPDTYPNGDTSLPPYKGCCKPGVGGVSLCGIEIGLPGGPNLGCVNPADYGVTTTAQQCTPAACKTAGQGCSTDSDCCAGPAGSGACITFTGNTATCTDHCKTNGDCASGCCVLLINGRGVCAPDASSCGGTACRKIDDTCDNDSDCCSGAVCAPNGSAGPRLCRPTCTDSSTCSGELCVKDASGRGTCATQGGSLCTDTCSSANDGSCDDGGTDSQYTNCTLGTDCTDCGPRLGGFERCSDACGTSNNGTCEDGTGTAAPSCNYGEDCTDCGPHLGVCTDDCVYHDDGVCDDGGTGAADTYCAFGTDCADCGGRIGGRGQLACDGTTGSLCTPSGDALNSQFYLASGCDCPDCAWDSGPHDCGPVANKCDGKTLGYCCAPGNPCGWDGDGLCDCGGWCTWEKTDCGSGAFPPRCDGFSISSYCAQSNASSYTGGCDCGAACSWETDCASYGDGTCKDTCATAKNGKCEDGSVGSTAKTCTIGTDCADCGPRP